MSLKTFGFTLMAVLVHLGLTGCMLLPFPRETTPFTEYPEYIPLERLEAPEEEPVDISDLSEEERTTIGIYRKYNRSVVNITSLSPQQNWLGLSYPQQGSGSGLIISSDGLVLTNYHVVRNALSLYITLYNGSAYDAEVVGRDPENDLALLRFEAESIEFIDIAEVKKPQVGQKVVALGNPFGLERTLTVGVVSAVKRPLTTEDGFILKNLIQVDAAINPGNSGGPLINMKGKVIGINTMIITPTGGSVGIGFAVPVETVRRVLPDLIEFGRVQRGWIDIIPVPLYPELIRRAGLPNVWGILISEVKPGSPAERAGLAGGDEQYPVIVRGQKIYLGGDIIYGIDGNPVSNLLDYLNALEDKRPGETVELNLLRRTYKDVIEVELSERPSSFMW